MSQVAHEPDVGAQIRKAREARGLSQVQLAELAEVAERSVQMWEANDRVPRMGYLRRLAAALGEPIAYFYGDNDPTPEPTEAAA